MKYPRTYHVPFSPGATTDDKRLTEQEFGQWFLNKPVVITEKLDGSNSCLTQHGVYARSHGNITTNPWDKNLWVLHDRIKNKLSADEMVFGENLYAEHSIIYNRLPEYFFIFACNNGDYDDSIWYHWTDVELMADILGLPTVPVLWKGEIKSTPQLKEMIDQFMSEPSAFGDEKEGVVIRNENCFRVRKDGKSIFHQNVCKYVRANHVQTDIHWTKNWKKTELYEHKEN